MPKPIKSRSAGALAAKLRGGGGKHGDRRLKRQKTRAGRKAAALKE